MRFAVFAGSATGTRTEYAALAAALGTTLARRGVGIVYGGGKVGLMGALADAALAAGGEVVGIMPKSLVDKEIAHRGLTRLRVVEDMHRRKAAMAEAADGFIALPGGAGTLEELFEAWTWQQLGLHTKPVALLGPPGFWQPLTALADHLVDTGFVRPTYRNLITGTDPGALLDAMARWQPPTPKWETPSADDALLDSVGWICVRDRRLLAVRTHGKDAFYLPGGKLEPGETPARALARELREELGLTCAPERLAHAHTVEAPAHGRPGVRLRMHCYTGPADGMPTPGAEIAELAWLTAADTDRCAPALREVMARLDLAS
ncbi:TIGR00730 family Rossman fold protein [Kitasatospora sp. NPDC051984]|uniref:TIGR00730 family Rossman fold protein n=1 Tax=Kitasatospora sp. NPDC051984 TaxID=3364059 RepID=UPI0037CC3D34